MYGVLKYHQSFISPFLVKLKNLGNFSLDLIPSTKKENKKNKHKIKSLKVQIPNITD